MAQTWQALSGGPWQRQCREKVGQWRLNNSDRNPDLPLKFNLAAKSAAISPQLNRASGSSPTASADSPLELSPQALTRRYHGLLIAALQPPVGRTQLVAALDETVRYGGTAYALATHRWASGAVDPQGFLYLESFRLEGATPVWTYALADALLEKRVWMVQGENTTFIHYTLARASSPLEIDLKALVNYRDFHSVTHAGDWRMKIAPVENGVMVLPFDGATLFYLKSAQASCEPQHEWYRDCYLPRETERGLDDREDYLFAALFHAKLNLGESLTYCRDHGGNYFARRWSRLARNASITNPHLLEAWQWTKRKIRASAPGWLRQLVLAADQFIVKRSLPEEPDGRSMIAGYHWFGDWGRDTMIALPGLALVDRSRRCREANSAGLRALR